MIQNLVRNNDAISAETIRFDVWKNFHVFLLLFSGSDWKQNKLNKWAVA